VFDGMFAHIRPILVQKKKIKWYSDGIRGQNYGTFMMVGVLLKAWLQD